MAVLAVRTFLGQQRFSSADIHDGLASVRWDGRLAVLKPSPLVLCDVAHNPDGIKALADTLVEIGLAGRIIPIFGAYKDKDISRMVQLLASISDKLVVIPLDEDRGCSPEVIVSAARSYFQAVNVCTTFAEAVKLIQQQHPGMAVIACGSFRVVAAAMRWKSEISFE